MNPLALLLGLALTHGPVVSGVSDSTAMIFFRTNQTAGVAVEYSLFSDLHGSTVTTIQPTSADDDYTVHVPLSGLLEDTRYYYTVQIDGDRLEMPAYPTFVTFPDPDSTVTFHFSIVSDASSFPSTSGIVYKYVDRTDPAFVLRIGDFDHRNPSSQSNPSDIEDWRTMHKDMIRDTAVGREFARSVGRYYPVISMWDDHDYGANSGDKNAEWKPIATQAFREYHPNYPAVNPEGGLWFSFRYAQAEFFVLDLRSQRDYFWDEDNEDKSMLDGDLIENDQKKWLLRSLSNSTATWKFIVSTVSWNTTVLQSDAWVGYQTERTEIMDYISINAIENVIVISGDIHTGGAIDDGTHAGLPEMSVPHFNNLVPMYKSGCSTPFDCGDWSEGWINGDGNPGMAQVTVRGNSSVILHTWSDKGQNQISLEVMTQ